MPGVRTRTGRAPDFRTRTGRPKCAPWTTTTSASAPKPPPPLRHNSRLHPQRTWCSTCGARRQHRRPDRGRPLHGDAGAHGTSDRLLDALGKLDGPFVVLVRGKPSILPARALGADAIVQAFTPRMQAGGAVAEPLLGRTEPSGWLPVPYQPRPGQHGDSAPV
jgi:hypothetical protein